jgi:hypothetical protein
MREKFGMSFKFALPERLRRLPDPPRLKPLLSSFRPSVNRNPESRDNGTRVMSIIPVTAPPFLGSRGEHRLYKTPTPLIIDGARSGTLSPAIDTPFIPPTPPTKPAAVTLPPPRPASPAESTFTLTKYAPSLVLPDSPSSSSIVPSSQGTPDSADKPGKASTRSSRRGSPESVYSERTVFPSSHARSDPSTMPPVPPVPQGTSPFYGRSDTVVVRKLLRDRVGRTDHVISRAFSSSSHIERADSITSQPPEGEPIAGPSTHRVKKKSNKPNRSVDPKVPPRSYVRPTGLPSSPQTARLERKPGVSRRLNAVYAFHAPNSAPPVLPPKEDQVSFVEAPSETYDDVLDFYATTAPLRITKVRSRMPSVPPRAMVMGSKAQLSKPSAMTSLRVGTSSSQNSSSLL